MGCWRGDHRVLKTGLQAEMSEHLGYDKHAAEGRNRGNSHNGTRSKTVLTELGPVQIDMPATATARSNPRPSADPGAGYRAWIRL
jgi:hypothetical protein